MTLEQRWREATNEELLAATARPLDFTDDGWRAIQAELERRGLDQRSAPSFAVAPSSDKLPPRSGLIWYVYLASLVLGAVFNRDLRWLALWGVIGLVIYYMRRR